MARRKDPAAEAPPDLPEDLPPEPITEPVLDPMPEATKAPMSPEPTAPVAPKPRRGGLMAPLLGGALAAIGGFGLSHFNLLGLAPPNQSEALAALEHRVTQGLAEAADPAALAALQDQFATLTARLDALDAAPSPDLSALEARLLALESLPPGDAASTAALAARLAELEQRLAAQPQGTDQAEVDAALARLEAAEAEAAARAEEAAAAAKAAEETAARQRLREAAAAGQPFAAELAALDDPALAALEPHTAGVATLAALQAEFPDAARASLALARETTGDGWADRLFGFLADQTEARPLTPQDGDSPEAVLSRAEFALGEGRLPEALAELAMLDDPLRAPFADWITRAEARLAVETALGGL